MKSQSTIGLKYTRKLLKVEHIRWQKYKMKRKKKEVKNDQSNSLLF